MLVAPFVNQLGLLQKQQEISCKKCEVLNREIEAKEQQIQCLTKEKEEQKLATKDLKSSIEAKKRVIEENNEKHGLHYLVRCSILSILITPISFTVCFPPITSINDVIADIIGEVVVTANSISGGIFTTA